jgi:hypothetical protein
VYFGSAEERQAPSGSEPATRRVSEMAVYGPPLNTHCTALEGPAAVRISNARALADELDAAQGGLHR